MHIELVALEISNDVICDGGAPHALRWLRQRGIATTLDQDLRPSVFAPHAVRVSTSVSDIRAASEAGYGLVVAIARSDEQRERATAAGAHVVVSTFAQLPGALLAVMRSPRRLAPACA